MGGLGSHQRKTTFTSGPGIFLLGLVHGHFDVQNLNDDLMAEDNSASGAGIHTGIGVVVPVDKILETINEPEWAEGRKRSIMDLREKDGAVADGI
jgi:hypothetical protein